MLYIIRSLIVGVLLALVTTQHVRSQEASAQQAAEDILRSFSNQEFKLIWEKKTSQWAHKNWSQDVFLSNVAMGRPQLGTLQSISTIAREHTTRDEVTGFEGDIYAITFRNKYTVGEFFERIVVVKDPDGQYRLSGFYGSPVPTK